MDTTVREIAALVGGTVVGDGSVRVTGVNGIRQAVSGDVTFVDDSRYRPCIQTTTAAAILVPDSISEGPCPLIQVSSPYRAFSRVVGHFRPRQTQRPEGIHSTAIIGRNVKLGPGAAIGAHGYVGDDCEIGSGVIVYPGAHVGEGCQIGTDTLLYPNATVREHVRIGERCIIHSGAVIGSDGFGFSFADGHHERIPQLGVVIIGDDVEIGANSAVDRATFGVTVIGKGTKIDNLVQIGHNVEIGEHCVICGNAGIAGSARLGNYVTIAAGAGVAGHIEVGDKATVAAYSGVSKSVEPGEVVFGYPALEHGRAKRVFAAIKNLPDLLRKVRALEQRIAELEGQLHGNAEDHR